MRSRHRRSVALVIGAALLLGAVGTSYVERQRAAGSLALGPAELVEAPAPAPAATSRTARLSRTRAPATGPTVSPGWVATYAARAGIPPRALTAYADAALRAPCPIGWTTLAGIGWVESQHGTENGRPIRNDGRPIAPVFGPELDGHGHLAAIRNAGGRWERAIGPLQFLPSTWRRWASDGDGDGTEDPQDLDDAAYAAARYLCASGQDVTTGAGWAAAIRSYNHSDAYVRAVYAAASAYAARSDG